MGFQVYNFRCNIAGTVSSSRRVCQLPQQPLRVGWTLSHQLCSVLTPDLANLKLVGQLSVINFLVLSVF